MLVHKPHTVTKVEYKEVIENDKVVGYDHVPTSLSFKGLYQPKTNRLLLEDFGYDIKNGGILLFPYKNRDALETRDRIDIDGQVFAIVSDIKVFTATAVGHCQVVVQDINEYTNN